MSTVTITITPTSTATAVSITGLLRSDTGLPPAGVSLPIALTISGSNWVGTFTDANPPFFYTATATINYVSGSPTPPFQSLVYGPGGPPSGLYGTIQEVQSIYSGSNVNLWPADAYVSTIPLNTIIQGAFNRADNFILQKLANQQFIWPSPPGTTAQQAMQCQSLGWIESELVGVFLYEQNGLQDQTKGMDGKMQSHRDNAEDQLRDLMFLNNAGFARIPGYVDAPTFAAATVTPAGLPVDPYPPYPIPVWSGYRWLWGALPGQGLPGPGYGWPVA